jgi:hypothetical protein
VSIARTIEIIRRNAFEEADGNSLGCTGPTHVMLKNADAVELVEYAVKSREVLEQIAKGDRCTATQTLADIAYRQVVELAREALK